MLLRRRPPRPQALFVAGALLCAVANITHHYFRPGGGVAMGLSDGLFGVLTGAGIGCLLWSLRRRCAEVGRPG
jgi:hypothetical protein